MTELVKPIVAKCETRSRPRASARLKRRTLAARLDALAERHIRELEASACVDPDKPGEALELEDGEARRPPASKAPRAELAPEEASPPSDSSASAAWTSACG